MAVKNVFPAPSGAGLKNGLRGLVQSSRRNPALRTLHTPACHQPRPTPRPLPQDLELLAHQARQRHQFAEHQRARQGRRLLALGKRVIQGVNERLLDLSAGQALRGPRQRTDIKLVRFALVLDDLDAPDRLALLGVGIYPLFHERGLRRQIHSETGNCRGRLERINRPDSPEQFPPPRGRHWPQGRRG